MSKQTTIWEVIKNAGYEPIENRNIIVSYVPANLSDFRSTAFLAYEMFGHNWHKVNLDATLDALRELKK